MRKLIKIAASAVGMFSLFLAGCSDIDSDDSATVSGGANSASSTKEITLNVSSNSDLVRFEAEDTSLSANVARNISPDALKASGLKFYIGGTNVKTGASLPVQEVAFKAKVTKVGENETKISETEGTVKIDLNPANYRFTLLAYDSAAATQPTLGDDVTIEGLAGGAVLIAYANVDLRYTSNVSFFLTSDGLKGNSSVDLDFYLKDWSQNSKDATLTNDPNPGKTTDAVDIYLADMHTGARKYPTSSTTVSLTGMDGTTADKVRNVNWNNINFVGTYNLVFVFKVNGTVFKYSEPIDLLANQCTKKKFSTTASENKAIPVKDILQTKPTKPSYFYVGYKAPDSSELETSYYKAVFNWGDTSDSEDYFEIQLRELTDNTDITDDLSDWGDNPSGTITTYNNDFYGNVEKNWYAGSLLTNNTKAVFALPLGKKYLARIRAYNSLSAQSNSAADEWVYATNATDDSPAKFNGKFVTKESTSSSTTVDITGKKFTNSGIINLFRIRYHFNDTYVSSPAALTENKAYFFDQVYKSNEEAAGVAIMNPNGTNEAPYETETIVLKRGDASWVNWIVGSASITDSNRYPDKFETVGSTDAPNSAISYYKQLSGDDNKDLNERQKYTLATPQPTGTSLGSGFYKSSGVPATYRGFENLDLYANFTETEFKVEIRNAADYNIQNNMNISITTTGSGDGHSSQNVVTRDADGNIIEKDSFTYALTTLATDGAVSKSVANVVITCTSVVGAKTYDSMFVKFFDNGGTEIYRINASSSKTFTIPVEDLKPGTYVAQVCATTPAKSPYVAYNIFIKIVDSETSTETAPSSGNGGGTNP